MVRELAKGKDFLFADRGEANLKGFDEPVRLYEVRWQQPMFRVTYSGLVAAGGCSSGLTLEV